MSLWNYYIQRVTKISDGIEGIGSRYEQKRKHDVNRYTVIEYTHPIRVTIELQPPRPLQRYGFQLSPSGNDTQITYHWQVDLTEYKLLKYIPNGAFKNWVLSFARKHIMNVIKPATEQNFQKLKILLESGEVTLQDGRQTKLPA